MRGGDPPDAVADRVSNRAAEFHDLSRVPLERLVGTACLGWEGVEQWRCALPTVAHRPGVGLDPGGLGPTMRDECPSVAAVAKRLQALLDGQQETVLGCRELRSLGEPTPNSSAA